MFVSNGHLPIEMKKKKSEKYLKKRTIVEVDATLCSRKDVHYTGARGRFQAPPSTVLVWSSGYFYYYYYYYYYFYYYYF